MKKHITSVCIALICFLNAYSQENELKFGLRAFPALAWSRVEPDNYTDGSGVKYTFEGNGVKLRGGFGVFADYYLKDNYAIHFGVNYLIHSAGYAVSFANTTQKRDYSVSYIQIPVALKLISNEVTDGIKVYCTLGFAGNIRTSASVDGKRTYQETPGSEVKRYSKDMTLLAMDFIFSTGVEYELTGDTKLLVGISYMHGLFDINARKDDFIKNSSFGLRHSLIAIDLGIKF